MIILSDHLCSNFFTPNLEVKPSTLYELSGLFNSIHPKIKEILEDLIYQPAHSWALQKQIRKITLQLVHQKENEELVFIKAGSKEPNGNWQAPLFKTVLRSELTSFRLHHHIHFATNQVFPETIYSSLTELDIFQIYQIMAKAPLPWTILRDGCQNRATVVYQLLIAMGISETLIQKQYIMGSKIGCPIGEMWKYHVAISLKDEKGKIWLLDPSTSPELLLSLEQWRSKMSYTKSFEKINSTHLPLQRKENTVYHLEVCGNEYAVLSGNTIQKRVQNLNSYLKHLAIYRIHELVLNHPIFSQILGKKFGYSFDKPLLSEKAAHYTAWEKIESFIKKHSNLAVTSHEIKRLKAEYFIKKFRLINLVHYLKHPYALTEHITNDFNSKILEGRLKFDKEIHPVLKSIVPALIEQGFNSLQVKKIKNIIKIKTHESLSYFSLVEKKMSYLNKTAILNTVLLKFDNKVISV